MIPITSYNNDNDLKRIDEIFVNFAVVGYTTNSSKGLTEISSTVAVSQFQTKDIKMIFQELARQWRNETSGSSSPLEMIANENYLRIIKQGVEHKEIILPLILRELSNTPHYWFEALKIISNDNPVEPKDFTNYRRVTQAWLNWGKRNGYL